MNEILVQKAKCRDEDVADAIQDTILVCWEKIGTLKKHQYFC